MVEERYMLRCSEVEHMATTKRKHIQVGKPDKVVVSAGPHSNKLHIGVTLTHKQERKLLKMLKERHEK